MTAAREMFVEFGPDVPLDEIARRAGVGNATLYRQLPRPAPHSIHEVVLSVMARTSPSAAERALAEEADAFEALRALRARGRRRADRRPCARCSPAASTSDHPDLLAARERLEDGRRGGSWTRATAAGQLRTDVAVGDLMVALSQLTRPLPGTACLDIDRFVHRHLQLFLDGLRGPGPLRTAGHGRDLGGPARSLTDDVRPVRRSLPAA